MTFEAGLLTFWFLHGSGLLTRVVLFTDLLVRGGLFQIVLALRRVRIAQEWLVDRAREGSMNCSQSRGRALIIGLVGEDNKNGKRVYLTLA